MLIALRLWSIHPQYLDVKGLVAVWREGLLAQAVLGGLTRGYTQHPQLIRFRPRREAIAMYLHAIADEADRRGYAFDRSRITAPRRRVVLTVTAGQLEYEWAHLKRKLRERSPADYRRTLRARDPLPHSCFRVVRGGGADWEVRTPASRAPRRSSRDRRAHR
ncbi:MAG TPA: pyrimidine dimer DNA glycosylase/endonuclease V [Thermoanaerobaculia bacterium]|nr:pyrimidine dimer DNA glycosylase/endonuclease V [Thermoanaerobaculia bacterium]